MLRKFTTLAAIAALAGSLTLSTAVDARGFRGGGGWRGGGGGGDGAAVWRGGYGRGWGYGGWGALRLWRRRLLELVVAAAGYGCADKEAAQPYADSSRARPRMNSMQAASSPISTNSSGWWASSMRPGPHNTVGTSARWNCPASEA